MGMAASQARLLCITARIHDVEYQAQAIQAAKVQLATQSDRIYQEYQDALSATTLTISAIDPKSAEKSTVAATFNNLCSRNRLKSADGAEYAITNSNGLLLVEDEIEAGYYKFTTEIGSDDPYEFALFMINNGQDIAPTADLWGNRIRTSEEAVYESVSNKDENLRNLHDKLLQLTGGDDIYDANPLIQTEDKDKIKEYEDTLKQYKNLLYKSYAGEVYAEASGQGSDYNIEEDFNKNLFNYYVSIFKQIQTCGGCISIDEYQNAANDSEWLTNMVQSGQLTINIIETDKKTGKIGMEATSPSSDTCLTYTETSYIDNRALAKAEAEYEHKLKQIDKKDEQFDLDLSKLETERTALTTEYDSIKKVIEDNVERTFGIFS